jgi:adenosine deaminase
MAKQNHNNKPHFVIQDSFENEVNKVSYLTKLPKAELHLHIEGTLEPELMLELAKRNSIQLPYQSVEEIKKAYEFNNLQEFLDLYYQGSSVLLKKQDFFDLTYNYIKRVSQDAVEHVEIFFDPQAHMARGVSFQTVFEGIYEALEKGQKDFNISFYLIMCFLRHLSEEDAIKTLEASLPYKKLIKAVGLDSSEMGHPPSKFKNVFKLAKEHGFECVAHAGEEGPAEYIWEALNLLQISRIDHGVRCLEDELLMAKIIDEQIPLTVCPLSNIKLKVFSSLNQHNLKKLFQRGVCVTINSDDPSYFGGYLADNFVQCQDRLNLTLQEMTQIAKNSFKASFLADAEKKKYIQKIDNYFKDNILSFDF